MSFETFVLSDIAEINPPETAIKKGTLAKKILLENLIPYTRKINGYEIGTYNGGSKFRNKDVLLSRISPTLENGKVSQVTILNPEEIAFGSTEFIILRAKENIVDSDYLYYLAISKPFIAEAINLMTGTSGRKRVSTDGLKEIKISLPSLSKQKSIAKELSLIDDKIELNSTIIKNIEEYLLLLYYRWFIDFNFPNDFGKPYKDNGGVFISNNGREIPSEWSTESIGNLFSKSITGEWGKDTEEPLLIESLSIRGADFSSWTKGETKTIPRRYIDNEKKAEKALRHGDIVIEISGGSPTQSTGRTIVVRESILKSIDQQVYCSNFSKILRPKEEFYSSYLYLTLTSLYNDGVFFHYEGKTTGLKNLLLPSLLKRITVLKPNKDILLSFEDLAGSLFDKINLLGKENELLQETRDLLIYKYIQ